MATDHDRELGALGARMAALEKTVVDIDRKVGEMRDVMMMGNGVWKVAAIIGGVFLIVLGGVISHIVSLIWTR